MTNREVQRMPDGATEPMPTQELAPLAEDLSIWVIPGRTREPGQAITQAVDAERIGFKRVWLSERFDLKDAGALCGGILARTSRLIAGTGIMAAGARSPLMAASMAATLQAAYDERFVLGLGRSMGAYLEGQGIAEMGFEGFEDYIGLLRQLFAGETVTYDGPAGSYHGMKTVDPCPGRPPEIWATGMGGPRATKLAARAADGLILPGFLTAETVHRVKTMVREERERVGLDPDSFTLLYYMVVANDLDETYTRAITHARFLTYVVGMPAFAKAYVTSNGWDARQMEHILDHPQFSAMTRATADQEFHREDMLEATRRVPDEWMHSTSAIGSVDDCVRRIQEYRDAGADEIGFYGSTPAENEAVVKGWRRHVTAKATSASATR